MAKETILSNLNVLTFKTQKGFQNHVDEIGEFDLVLTPDQSLKGTLLDFKWADHILNDVSWLRADTFSWHSGDVYVAAYNHLAEEMPKPESVQLYCWKGDSKATYEAFYTKTPTPDISTEVFYMEYGVLHSEGTDELDDVGDGYLKDNSGAYYNRYPEGDMVAELPIETHKEVVSGITITYYQAADKHKICLPDQEANLSALYEATGVAWYYILDTENKQFKLPRSKHNKYASTLPVVGNGMNLGLTDGTTNIGFGFKTSDQSLKGRTDFYGTDVGTYGALGGVASAAASGYSFGVTTDPEKSGIIATQEQDSDQYKYLYFYVGAFDSDGLEANAGINTETFNSKADLNLMNTTSNVDIVIESQLPTADNGYTWYRKYKSGWVEQGGVSSSQTVTLPIEMADTSYSIQLTGTCDSTKNNVVIHGFRNRTTTSFVTQGNVVNNSGESAASNTSTKFWQVSGYAA